MSFCRLFDCEKCERFSECGGCERNNGHPFAGTCIAAEVILKSGLEGLKIFKQDLILKINALNIPYVKIDELYILSGYYVNLEYPLDNNTKVKFLKDEDLYFGCQIELNKTNKCLGIVTNGQFVVISEYETNGSNPKLILYNYLS